MVGLSPGRPAAAQNPQRRPVGDGGAGNNNPDFLAWASDTFLQTTIARGRRGTPMFPSLRGLGGVRQFAAAEIDDLVAYLRGWRRLR